MSTPTSTYSQPGFRKKLIYGMIIVVLFGVMYPYTDRLAAIKKDFKLRQAEDQLHRMSDRELSDIGLCRADIAFAVRDAEVEGVMPPIRTAEKVESAAANRNTNPAIFWAGRA